MPVRVLFGHSRRRGGDAGELRGWCRFFACLTSVSRCARCQVVRHVLARHDPFRCREVEAQKQAQQQQQQQMVERVQFRGNELLGMVTVSLSAEDTQVTRDAVLHFCNMLGKMWSSWVLGPFLLCYILEGRS